MAIEGVSLAAQKIESVCRVGGPLGREDPLEEEMATHSNILAWKFLGLRKLTVFSSWGHKEWDTTECLLSLPP